MLMWKFGLYKDDNGKFIAGELFKGRLRQGWGVETLDLRSGEDQWKRNYINICRVCWEVEAHDKERRWNILSRMLEMRVGDIVFLGKFSRQGHDEDRFTVATVEAPYYFDNSQKGGLSMNGDDSCDCCRDFRHVIPITQIQTYDYSNQTLLQGVFGASLMDAVIQIQSHFKCYPDFENFARKNYIRA